jgi:7-carboxy-7-deazaguanine synthase
MKSCSGLILIRCDYEYITAGMFGKNPKRRPVKGEGTELQVQAIFGTVQGEGPHTGVPSVFIRLGGCNLACYFCDTEFESFTTMSLPEIMAEVTRLAEDGRELVVITGGEPLRQPIALLCQTLLEKGFKPQIETNGTLWQPLPEGVEIICSPKTTTPLREDLLARITAFKFVLAAGDMPPEVGQTQAAKPVWIQPMDVYDDAQNLRNLEYVLSLAAEKGYAVSLQTHKLFHIE